jgi:hypothetical protein
LGYLISGAGRQGFVVQGSKDSLRDENGQSIKKLKFCESRHHHACKITKIRRIIGFLKIYGLQMQF